MWGGRPPGSRIGRQSTPRATPGGTLMWYMIIWLVDSEERDRNVQAYIDKKILNFSSIFKESHPIFEACIVRMTHRPLGA